MHWKNYLTQIPWFTPDEQTAYTTWLTTMDEQLDALAIEKSTLIYMKLEDVFTSFVYIRRIEQELTPQPFADTDAPPDKNALTRCLDAAGKARERWRKAMKELETSCTKNGTALTGSLAESLHPLLQKTKGVPNQAAEQTPSDETDDDTEESE